MAKTPEPVVISDVLLKQSKGMDITLREARAVAQAVGALRDKFNDDMFKAMRDPSSLENVNIECLPGLAALLFEFGFISAYEMKQFQDGIRML